MGGTENIVSDVFGLAVTVFVATVVWGVLAAGTFQLVRDTLRHGRVT